MTFARPFAGSAPPAPEEAPRPRPTDDYADLKRIIAQRGLLEKRARDSVGQIVSLIILVAVTAACLLLTHGAWRLLGAVSGAVLFGQLGFLAHDAAHNQIFRSSPKNYVTSLLLWNLLLGVSRGWWVDKHNKHHGAPNQIGKDPDTDFSVMAMSAQQTTNARGLARVMIRHQAKTLMPLLLFEGLSIQVHSTRFIARWNLRNALAEVILLAIHYALYIGAIVLLVGFPGALLFILIHQTLTGAYVGMSFVPNHIGMPVLGEEERLDFFRQQVLTARNIRANPIADWLFGALSCQIEHHLFPAMPRNRLRTAAPIVRAFCEERAVAYRETGVFQAYVEVHRSLASIGGTLRRRPATS